jgi:hypothetical protein
LKRKHVKLIFSSPIAPEAGLLKSLLDEARIPSEIRNENVHPILPGAAFQPEIWVLNDEDYAQACRVRDAWQESASSEASQQHSEGNRRPSRATLLVSGLGSLLFVGLAVRSQRRFAETGDARNTVGTIVLLLVAILFIWLAATLWRDWKSKR